MDTQLLNLSQGTLAYADQGRGPLVLLAPSLGDIRQEYRFLAPLLVDAGYRVVTLDLRGHGESSAGWPDYELASVGRDFLALIRSLDAGPALIVGTSFSAGAAVWAAAEAPELVAGLVLVGPFVRDTMPAWQAKLLFSPLFSGPWATAAWMTYFKTLYPSTPPADFPQYQDRLRANLKEPGRMAAVRGMMTASKQASEERLAQVTAPVLVVMGTQDPDFKDPQAEAQLVAGRLNGQVKMIAGAGHYPHAEKPADTGKTILAFFETLRLPQAHGA